MEIEDIKRLCEGRGMPTDGFVAVMIWMPQRTSAALLERMEAETAAFVSKLHAAKDMPL